MLELGEKVWKYRLFFSICSKIKNQLSKNNNFTYFPYFFT